MVPPCVCDCLLLHSVLTSKHSRLAVYIQVVLDSEDWELESRIGQGTRISTYRMTHNITFEHYNRGKCRWCFLCETMMEVFLQYKTPSCRERSGQQLSIGGHKFYNVGL